MSSSLFKQTNKQKTASPNDVSHSVLFRKKQYFYKTSRFYLGHPPPPAPIRRCLKRISSRQGFSFGFRRGWLAGWLAVVLERRQRSVVLRGAQAGSGSLDFTSCLSAVFRHTGGREGQLQLVQGRKDTATSPTSFCFSGTNKIVTYSHWGECLWLELVCHPAW